MIDPEIICPKTGGERLRKSDSALVSIKKVICAISAELPLICGFALSLELCCLTFKHYIFLSYYAQSPPIQHRLRHSQAVAGPATALVRSIFKNTTNLKRKLNENFSLK